MFEWNSRVSAICRVVYNLIKFASMLISYFLINERLDCFNRGYVNNSSFGDENQRSRGFAVPAVTLSAPPIGRWNEWSVQFSRKNIISRGAAEAHEAAGFTNNIGRNRKIIPRIEAHRKGQDDWLPMRFLPDIDHDLLRSRCRSRPFLSEQKLDN